MNVGVLRSLWPETGHAEWMSDQYVSGLASVIVPTYNRSDTVLETLQSVVDQTYRPIELIVVDDGSTDATNSAVSAWQRTSAEDESFSMRYLYQDNSGAPCARNRGLLECHGEYIQFLDSDDVLHAEKIARQVRRLEADEKADFVYSGTSHFHDVVDPSVPPYAGLPMGEGSPLAGYLTGHMWNTVSGLYRRRACSAIGPWNAATPIYQDWEYNIRFILGDPRVEYLEGTLSFARCTSTDRVTASQTSEASLKGRLASRIDWLQWIRSAGRLEIGVEHALGEQIFHVLVVALDHGHVAVARDARGSLQGLHLAPGIARDAAIYSLFARLPGKSGPTLARCWASIARVKGRAKSHLADER